MRASIRSSTRQIRPASGMEPGALRDAAGLRGLRFHDLRHTVVTPLLEAGEPDHVVESITGHLSRRMLEHYSPQGEEDGA